MKLKQQNEYIFNAWLCVHIKWVCSWSQKRKLITYQRALSLHIRRKQCLFLWSISWDNCLSLPGMQMSDKKKSAVIMPVRSITACIKSRWWKWLHTVFGENTITSKLHLDLFRVQNEGLTLFLIHTF